MYFIIYYKYLFDQHQLLELRRFIDDLTDRLKIIIILLMIEKKFKIEKAELMILLHVELCLE